MPPFESTFQIADTTVCFQIFADHYLFTKGIDKQVYRITRKHQSAKVLLINTNVYDKKNNYKLSTLPIKCCIEHLSKIIRKNH